MSRSAINKAFIEAMEEDFALHGKKTLELLRKKNPRAYLLLAARLLPRTGVEKSEEDNQIIVTFTA